MKIKKILGLTGIATAIALSAASTAMIANIIDDSSIIQDVSAKRKAKKKKKKSKKSKKSKKKRTISSSVTVARGKSIEVTAKNATSLKSSNAKIATVARKYKKVKKKKKVVRNKFVITAKNPGTATITITNRGLIYSIKINVPHIKVSKVVLNKTHQQLTVGKSFTLKASVSPTNTTQSKKIRWSTSHSDVATVNSNGTVTAKNAGTTLITAKGENGKSASCRVVVTPVINATEPEDNKPTDTTTNPKKDDATYTYDFQVLNLSEVSDSIYANSNPDALEGSFTPVFIYLKTDNTSLKYYKLKLQGNVINYNPTGYVNPWDDINYLEESGNPAKVDGGYLFTVQFTNSGTQTLELYDRESEKSLSTFTVKGIKDYKTQSSIEEAKIIDASGANEQTTVQGKLEAVENYLKNEYFYYRAKDKATGKVVNLTKYTGTWWESKQVDCNIVNEAFINIVKKITNNSATVTTRAKLDSTVENPSAYYQNSTGGHIQTYVKFVEEDGTSHYRIFDASPYSNVRGTTVDLNQISKVDFSKY